MPKAFRSPSIVLILSVIFALLLLPFVVVSLDQWQSASAQVDSAARVLQATDEVDKLLRLPTAIDTEIFVLGSEQGTEYLIAQLPEVARPFVQLDVGITSAEAASTVDELVASVGDPELTQLVDDARTVIATGGATDVLVLERAFSPVGEWLTRAIEQQILALSAGASGTGELSVARLARISEATTDLQLTLSGMDWRWATIAASDFFPSTINDRMRFTHGLIAYESQAAVVDSLLPTDGPIRARWNELANSPELTELLEEYRTTAEALSAGTLDLPEPGTNIDLGTIDFVAASALGSQITGTISNSAATAMRFDALFEASIDGLRNEAAAALQATEADRQTTVGWLAVSSLLFVIAIAAVALLIGRPVRRMAHATTRLGEGDLDIRVPERGPREILAGAQALNQALTSLKITEAQAFALAEERLDDPVLAQRTPGHLGASLQTAVHGLTHAITEREQAQTELEYEATHDGLTSLANRRAILGHLDMARSRSARNGQHAALLFVDIDEFKKVNDAFGHQGGDAVLTEVARRLESCRRTGDLAGRLGGDEFVLVAEPIADASEAMALAARVHAAVTQPITVDGNTIELQASIGVGLSNERLSAEDHMRDADLAVFRAKREGGNMLYLCDEELREQVRQRSELEEEIRRGIRHDEFELYYQPAVRTSDHQMVSVEALIRWNHPERGLLTPDAFIPVAELSDLIVDLDCWVLDAACRQLESWQNHEPDRDAGQNNLTIAVNISAQHFRGGRLANDVRLILAAHDVNPNDLVLEVTETAIVDDMDAAATELEAAQSLGVRVALDDYGTGFMSITHLRSLPVDIVKIDASFTQDIETTETKSLMRLIAETGHVLGMSVTVEGVETQLDVELLTEIGADTYQGYLFGKPVRSHELPFEMLAPLDIETV